MDDAAGARIGNDAARQLDRAAERAGGGQHGPDREHPLGRLRHEDRPVRQAARQILSAGRRRGHWQGVGRGNAAVVVTVGREGTRRERENHDEGDQGRGGQVAPPAHQQRNGDPEDKAAAADGERKRIGFLEVALEVVSRREAGCPGRGARSGWRRRRLRDIQCHREQVGASVHRYGEEDIVRAGMLAPMRVEPVAAVRQRQGFSGAFRRLGLDHGVSDRLIGIHTVEEDHQPAIAGDGDEFERVRAR
ncbi:hypothetical protein GCM10025880_27820 [Methylorubrum aminovorans]|nr:hypothetical protein GCM10025880_27820 [Methylorubrum aminovorans]